MERFTPTPAPSIETVPAPKTIEALKTEMTETRKTIVELINVLAERGKTYPFEGITEAALSKAREEEAELGEYFPDEMVKIDDCLALFKKQNIALDRGDDANAGNMSAVPAEIHREGDRAKTIAHSLPLRHFQVSQHTDLDLASAIRLYQKYDTLNTELKALEKTAKK